MKKIQTPVEKIKKKTKTQTISPIKLSVSKVKKTNKNLPSSAKLSQTLALKQEANMLDREIEALLKQAYQTSQIIGVLPVSGHQSSVNQANDILPTHSFKTTHHYAPLPAIKPKKSKNSAFNMILATGLVIIFGVLAFNVDFTPDHVLKPNEIEQTT